MGTGAWKLTSGCIDAYAYLGKYYLGDERSDWWVRKASKCYLFKKGRKSGPAETPRSGFASAAAFQNAKLTAKVRL
ncbi:MAG: hypothetical protein AB1374_06850 [Bacillota bacterium]